MTDTYVDEENNLQWRRSKEQRNIRKHKLDFSFAARIIYDPLSVTVFDRYEDGEARWHTIAKVYSKTLLVVHTEREPMDIISLREATPDERKRYEEGEYGD